MRCLIHSAASLSNSMPAEIGMRTWINWFRQHLPEAERVTDVTIKTAECGTSGEIGNLFWHLMQLSHDHTEQLFAIQPVSLFWSGSVCLEMGIQSLQRHWRCICVHYRSTHIPLGPSLTFPAPKVQTQQSQTQSFLQHPISSALLQPLFTTVAPSLHILPA